MNVSVSPGNNQVSLSWDKNIEINLQYYNLYRATPVITGPYTKIAEVDAIYNSFIDKNVIMVQPIIII